MRLPLKYIILTETLFCTTQVNTFASYFNSSIPYNDRSIRFAYNMKVIVSLFYKMEKV